MKPLDKALLALHGAHHAVSMALKTALLILDIATCQLQADEATDPNGLTGNVSDLAARVGHLHGASRDLVELTLSIIQAAHADLSPALAQLRESARSCPEATRLAAALERSFNGLDTAARAVHLVDDRVSASAEQLRQSALHPSASPQVLEMVEATLQRMKRSGIGGRASANAP